MADSAPPSDIVLDKGPLFTITSSTLAAFSCTLVFFRVLSSFRRKVVGLEDATVAFSAVIHIVSSTVGCLAVHYGFGRHRVDIPRSGGNLMLALLYFYLFQLFYKIVLCLNKLSFLFLYMRLFPTPKFRILCLISVAVIAGGTVGFIVATVFQCVPVERYWDRSIPGHCIDNAAFRWSWAPFNTILDIWVCLMPLPVIRRLQMSAFKKAGIMLLFALGLFVCVTSIIRMGALVSSTTTKDVTWGSFMALLWSSIEASCGLICTCLPFLKQPLKKLFPGLRSQWSGSSDQAKDYNYHLRKVVDSRPSRAKGRALPTFATFSLGRDSIDRNEEARESQEHITSSEIAMKVDSRLTTDDCADSISDVKRIKSAV